MLRGLFLFIALYGFQIVVAQKTLTAVKTPQSPVIDGSLQDAIWQSAPAANNFIQTFPSFGGDATSNSDVRILYDDDAIYIGAHLYDDPSLIRRQLTSRDEQQQKDVDFFSVFFDTYNDHQNGFMFLVTTANVQTDAKLLANSNFSFGEFGDETWDAVWQSQVKIVKDGWVVEMRIPYLSLRFAIADVQTWGLQFLRFTRRNNEYAYWNPVNPNENGYINQFGKYGPLENIKPPLRLSFSPYLTTGLRYNVAGNANKTEWLRNGGMDVKYGINESFTLDATLIPDFGQVISDNVVNNLSPFEVYFQENRPFFTEGTELFNKAAGLFYSRRIGAIPTRYYDVGTLAGNNYLVEKNPPVTQLYNAIKFSGRTQNKLGIGIFNAITAPMQATLRNKTSGKDSLIETEPLANYNIIVLDQALTGRSSVTFTNTNVIRNGTARDANVSALDWSLFTKDNQYRLLGTARYSRIFTEHPYGGFNSSLRWAKVSGKLLYNLQGNIISDQYNPRDLGFIITPNISTYNGSISYGQPSATKNFNSYRYSLNAVYERLYKPNVFNNLRVSASAFWWFKNFWDVTLTIGYLPDQHDYFLLRAPYTHFARRPAYSYAQVKGSSDSRKRLFFEYDVQLANFFNTPNKRYHSIEAGLRYRFNDRFTLSLSHSHEGETDYIVYAGEEVNSAPIIGFTNFKEVESILSAVFNFTSRVNLTLRTRHYWSHVPYNRFANVDVEGREVFRNPGLPSPDMDGNINYFNTDAFLTWDFQLGSRFIVGYKNWLGNPNGVLTQGDYLRNLKETFSSKHGNELTVKLIYFLDYNKLREKH